MTRIYIGSYQPQFKSSLTVDMDIAGKGNGIYAYEWDEEQGELTPVGQTYAAINPARLCYQRMSRRVYAASDTNEFLNWQAGSGGGVYAYDLQENGVLKFVDSRSSCGVRAVDICCDSTGEYVLCLNEGSDFCTTEFVQNEQGRYIANIRRDEGCVVVLRTDGEGFARVCDRYVLPEGVPAHPVMMHLDADGYVYIANRSGAAVSVLRLDAMNGRLLPATTIPLPDAPQGIAIHPNVPVLYASSPEHGDIRIFHFDPERKEATFVQKVFEEEESHPGHLTIAQDGQTLYCADAQSCEIKVYGVTMEGKLVLVQRVVAGVDAARAHRIDDMRLTSSGKWLFLTDILGDALIAHRVCNDGRLERAKRFTVMTPTGLLTI